MTNPAAGAESTALERAVLLGDTPLFDPFTGTERGVTAASGTFRAAELGLEAPRYCQLCGRKMVVQVNPVGWLARCSRHGELSSDAGSLK